MSKITIELEHDGDLGWVYVIRRGTAIITEGFRLNYRDAVEAALYHARNIV